MGFAAVDTIRYWPLTFQVYNITPHIFRYIKKTRFSPFFKNPNKRTDGNLLTQHQNNRINRYSVNVNYAYLGCKFYGHPGDWSQTDVVMTQPCPPQLAPGVLIIDFHNRSPQHVLFILSKLRQMYGL